MAAHGGVLMDLRVVLVGSEYEQNLGYCARVMKNFDFTELFLVNPQVKIGDEAKMYSKHAYDVLLNARIVDSFDKAIEGCTLVIGTTAITAGGRDVLRKPLTPREAAKLIVGKNQKVALVIGRDGTGLSKDELEKCDLVVRIPSSESYGALNISHALGILLYEFRMREKEIAKHDASVELLSVSEKKVIDQTLKSLVKSLKGIKGEKTTILSLKRIFNRGIRLSIEGKVLLNFLKKLDKQIKEKQISGKASKGKLD